LSFQKCEIIMHKTKLATYLIVLAATTVWSQQAPAPTPDQAAPVPIVRDPNSTEADLAVPLCPATFNDSLDTDGIAAMRDKSVTHPIPTYQPVPEASDEARRLNQRPLFFRVMLSLVVDAMGNPQNACLKQSAGYGLDAQAAKAVQLYRFKPATKDGNPVAKRIFLGFTFNLR
jgi:TonB family protein